MKNWFVMLAVAMIPVAAATVGAFEGTAPETGAIMKALFKKGAGSKSSILKSQSEAASPDWPAIQKTTKDRSRRLRFCPGPWRAQEGGQGVVGEADRQVRQGHRGH